ncbi:MAG: autotransporter outer membrane beta-barrel domain-containing protein [Candidatus Thiodiazotropha sp.]|jgi:outer membrane autotransporter protein
MIFFDKAVIKISLERTAIVYLILCFLFPSSKFVYAQQIDGCLDSGNACNILVSATPQLSEEGLSTHATVKDAAGDITALVGSGNATVSYISGLLQPYVTGNVNAVSTSNAIAETCLNKDNSKRVEEDCRVLLNAALQGDSHTTSALLQIMPRFVRRANNVARAGGVVQINNLKSRIKALRNGSRGLSFQGLDLKIYNQKLPIGKITSAYEKLRIQKSSLSAEQLRLDSSFGMFFTGDIITNKNSLADPESELNFDTNGVTLGADYRLTERLVLGSALGYIDTNSTLINGKGNLDTEGYSISFYGTYIGRKPYFIDFATSYGVNNIDQRRLISYQLDDIGWVNQEMTANYNSDKFSLFFGSGYDFKNNFWTFGPRMDLQYIKSYVGGFTEQSSDSSALGSGWVTRSSAINRHWLTWNLGGTLSYKQVMHWGTFEPYSRFDWLHEFKDETQLLDTYFIYDTQGNAIPVVTSDPDRDYLRLKVGTSAKFKRGLEAYFNYGTLFAQSGWTGRTVKIGFRMEL